VRAPALVVSLALSQACASASPASTPPSPDAASLSRRVGTMSELMADFIYPASDAVFYISSRTPTTGEQWMALQAQTLMLAESANLLMMPGRARDSEGWMADAKLLLDAGEAAYRAAKDRDVAALEALSDPLYESCVTCHRDYRPDYGRR
jgi:cytochrome c556